MLFGGKPQVMKRDAGMKKEKSKSRQEKKMKGTWRKRGVVKMIYSLFHNVGPRLQIEYTFLQEHKMPK